MGIAKAFFHYGCYYNNHQLKKTILLWIVLIQLCNAFGSTYYDLKAYIQLSILRFRLVSFSLIGTVITSIIIIVHAPNVYVIDSLTCVKWWGHFYSRSIDWSNDWLIDLQISSNYDDVFEL